MFFVPYAKGEEFSFYEKNSLLAKNYLKVCGHLLKGDEKVVCEYGEVGLFLAMDQLEQAESLLLSLVEQYPQGYLYQALGELYLKKDDTQNARMYLLKAVGMANSVEERFQIKSLLQKVI